MLKVLIWQVSDKTQFKDKAIEILECQHDGVEIVDSVVNEEITKVDRGGGYNLILVIGAKRFGMVGAKKIGLSQVMQDAKRFNLPLEKILGDWIVCIPGFTLEKYHQLQSVHLSIFAKDCFGGIVSNMLGLPFRSPFVNLRLSEPDFIRFMSEARAYMEKELIFKEKKWQSALGGFHYPVFTLGDVDLFMNHYPDFDEAKNKWYERKARINWENLFVTMSTANEKILEQFDMLPYDKKICFVPFKSDLSSAWYINPEIKKGEPFWRIVHLFGYGDPFYYDVFDMLLYGKKTPLIDM